jgi:DNA ligase-1
MLLWELVRTSREVAGTRSRTEKTARLAELLGRLEPAEAEVAVAYLSGQLRQRRTGLGPAAVAGVRDSSPAGEPSLSLADVDLAFDRIASASGPGSAATRRRELSLLFARATADERDFLARLVVGELRQGALAGSMVEAVARAAGVEPGAVRRALMLAGDLPVVARAALDRTGSGLGRFRLEMFQPIHPMLAQPAGDVAAAVSEIGRAALEYKLDGARVQVHRLGDDVRVYSRRLNDVTAAVPEIVDAAHAVAADSFVADGEVIALRADGTPRPFQETMRRFGRRLDVERARRELPLTPFLFDVLHADGVDLIDRPGEERAQVLDRIAPSLVVPRIVTDDPERALAFLDDALGHGHEGVMVKDLAAPYEAGSRGAAWRKVKRADTLDLVVLAAEWGHGRRSGWLSNLHLGARDPAAGGYVMLGKTFKGMTDRMLAWQTERFRSIALGSEGHVVHLRPEVVVEIAFGNIQESPHYPAGLALRFARVKRYREDKRPEEADTIDRVRTLYRQGAGLDR